MINSVAVYCGHQAGTNPNFIKDAAKLGELLARNKIKIVFGGGDVGLMGAVATGAIENGGEVVGITTTHVMKLQEPVHKDVKSFVVEGVNERKQKMYELSDAFCILPGGVGTLNELTDIMTMQQIGESAKPIFFLNTDKYWNIFGQMMVHMQDNGFMVDIASYKIQIANKPEALVNSIMNQKGLVSDSITSYDFNS